ncbi:uncharacterized protein LOC129299314 [Prosopis cineraria]|uniref:uncharacterized protein LOC129299314 n=1 Tax=Prosopis cineraria TaxID=364024 RepID=UPI00240FF59B|nr:uncharacterized protein LOC129299314 [Prosopis cineraria]
MAFSLRIGCTGSNRSFAKFGIDNNLCSLCGGAPRPMSVMFVGRQSRSRGQDRRITAAAALMTAPAMAATGFQENFLSLDMEPRGNSDRSEGKDAADASDRLDRWMRDSVVEIVKNLREAPLLVHVFPKGYTDGGGDGHMMKTRTTTATATLVTEKRATEENWPEAKGKWRQEMAPLPEGLILVEELTGDDLTGKERIKGRENTTKVWGVVVQGRRAGCGPVCYLLKTTRVGSCQTGPCCTHYCLTRVKDLMETVESQFKNLWLVHSENQ